MRENFTLVGGEQIARAADHGIEEGYKDSFGQASPFGMQASVARQASGARAYVVQEGDTLQRIAQAVWGDSSLWYAIAEANGLSNGAYDPENNASGIRAGQVLTLPDAASVGVGSRSSASTLRPYDPTEAIGNTAPNLPPPPRKKASFFSKLVMAVVAIVAAVYGVGLLAGSGALGGGAAAAASAGVSAASAAAAGTTLTSFATTWAAGVGVLGAGGAVGIAGGLAGGVLGSVASQSVGYAMGAQDEFSWKNVALSALSGAVSGGIGKSIDDMVVRTAVGNVITQGAAVATGLQRSFSWRGVAASAVGAGVGQAVGPGIGGAFGEAFGKNAGSAFAARLTTGLIAGAATAVMRGGKVAIQQIAVDAFGNALGSSLAEAMGPQNTAQENFRQSEIRAQNEQAGRGAVFSFDTSYSSMGLRAGAGNGVGLSYAGMRATGLPDEGQYTHTAFTPDLDTNAITAMRENLGLPEAAPDMGWQLADLGLRLGGTTGGYGPALRLGTMSASPLRTVPTQAAPITTDPGVIDYADYAERFTPPGVDLGSGDLLKTAKDAALNKLVEWGATSPEGSAWREAMGISYALTDAVLPGGYGEAAIGVGAGPLIGKGIVLGGGLLNATASKYTLTSWAAADISPIAIRSAQRVVTALGEATDGFLAELPSVVNRKLGLSIMLEPAYIIPPSRTGLVIRSLDGPYGLAGRDALADAISRTQSFGEARSIARDYKLLTGLVRQTEETFSHRGANYMTVQEIRASKYLPWTRAMFEGTARDRIFKGLVRAEQSGGRLANYEVTPQGKRGIDLFTTNGRLAMDLTTSNAWQSHVRTYKSSYGILLPLLYK